MNYSLPLPKGEVKTRNSVNSGGGLISFSF